MYDEQPQKATGCPKILYPLCLKPLDGQGCLNNYSKWQGLTGNSIMS